MECQVEKNEHFRHILLFEFNRGVKAVDAARNIRAVYGEDAIVDRTAQKWFKHFKEGNFSLEDSPRSGRPSEFDEDRLNDLIHDDPRQTTRELAEKLGCGQTTVVRHLNTMGKVQKWGVWVPHELQDHHKANRMNICASLLARHRSAQDRHQSFLSRIVTGDEKWCLYVNFKQRKEWLSPQKQATPRPKPELHPRKTMLCVWWSMEGVVHWELLPRNQTVNAALYCAQLNRVRDRIQLKQPNRKHEVILLHDNARPHVAKLTQEALKTLNWEVLPHPPYSPDIAPTDYYLFRCLSNDLAGASFKTDAELEKWLEVWFAHQDPSFYRHGIEKLVERWQTVIDKEGNYVAD